MSALLLGVTVASTPAQAQGDITVVNPGQGSIQGRIIIPEAPNQRLEQIPVRLRQGSGSPIGVVYTTGNGQFVFGSLSTGRYEISVNLPGFHAVSQTVEISRGSGRIQMQVHLRRMEAPSPPVTGVPSVSVLEMLAPAAASSEFAKGREKSRKDETADAERHLKKAVALYPAYPGAWVELGQVYARTGRPGEALASFREALRHDAKNREALLALARLLNDQNRFVEALRAAAQLEQLYAGDARNHLEIARGLLGAGKIEEAELAARGLEGELHSEAPEVHLVLFSICQRRGQAADAAGELRTYLKEMDQRGVPSSDAALVRARELLARLEKEIAAAK